MFKFTQGDYVRRVTKSRNLNSWSCILEWWIYKVSTVHNDYVTLDWIVWNISSDSLIKYEMQVWDIVQRIDWAYEDVVQWWIYKISSILPNDIRIEWSQWAYGKVFFEPVLTTDKDTLTINGIHPDLIIVDEAIDEDTIDDEDPILDPVDTSPFKVWDIVIRNTDKYETSLMKKWKAYKIIDIVNDNVIKLDWSFENYSTKYFDRIKFKFNVWDIVQSIKKNWYFKTWKVHTLSQNWSHFYFETVRWTQSTFKYKVSDFELVPEWKDANSNNDGCTVDTSINIGDQVQRIWYDSFEVKQWCTYKVYDIDKDNDLSLIIDWQPSTYLYAADWFIVIPIGPVGSIGDSIYPNPITPMKTFNEYAVEAFMSNEANRTNATNALATLNKLTDDLELAIEAAVKVRKVILTDLRRLQTAMEDSNIEVISALIAENTEVKEFVERFMENTLVQIIPLPENTNKTVQDKFK